MKLKCLTNILDKFVINLVMLVLCTCGRIGWYFFVVMLVRDVFVVIVRGRLRRTGIVAVEGARLVGAAKIGLRLALVVVALCPAGLLGGADEMVRFLLSALAMGMSLVSGMQILLLAMNAVDSSWLAGADGKIGVPNWWSLSRIAVSAVIPYMIGVQPFGRASNVIAVFMLAYAVSTDKVDGSLARRLNQFTKAGKALDPLSDKVLFYPVAVAIFVATKGTLLIPDVGRSAVAVVMWLSIGLAAVRDLAFVVWFGRMYKKLPDGVGAGIWDKMRMVVLCVWLGAMVMAMCTQGLLIGTVFAWVAYVCLVLAGLTLSIASGAVALMRVRMLETSLRGEDSE